MLVVNESSMLTGLPIFMLVTAGPTSDIELIYNLSKEYLGAISVMSNIYQDL